MLSFKCLTSCILRARHPCLLFFKHLRGREWLACGLEALDIVVNLCQSVLKLLIGAAVSLYGVVFQLFGLDIDARGFLHSALPANYYIKGAESVTFSFFALLDSEADLGLCCFHCVCVFGLFSPAKIHTFFELANFFVSPVSVPHSGNMLFFTCVYTSEGSYDNADIQCIEYSKVSPVWRIFRVKCPLSAWRLDVCLIICYK